MHSINLTNENIYTDLVTEQHLPKNTKTNNNVKINSEVSGNTPLPTSSVSENSDKKNKINYWY